MIRSVLLLLLAGLLLLSASGCETQGGVRSGQDFNDPAIDMIDSTGQFGRDQRRGAGDIYVKLAVGYMRDGRLDVALQKARRAIEVEPGNSDGHNIIALLYDRLGEYGLAESHFRKSVRLAPQNSYSLNAYGTFLCQQKRYEEADKQFNNALLNPLYDTPEVALTNAGICAKRKPDKALAERYLRRALAKQPVYAGALIQMAIISYENGEHLSSRGYLQRYQAVASPSSASLWLGIQNERVLGDQDAVASYTLLLQNNFPDSQEIQLLKESAQQ